MHILERWCIAFRHNRWLDEADRLWNWMRPRYDRMMALFGRNGLERTINGSDRVLVLPRFRGISETYEREVWRHLMAQVRPGDVAVDVGAFVGLYTIALAKRVGPSGRVISFEPDPQNFTALKSHVELNGVSNRVELIRAAAGGKDALVSFLAGGGSESRIRYASAEGLQGNLQTVRCVRLDTILAGRHLDILKIDVEGSEAEVLEGAVNLLQDIHCRPRAIYIEVHPYAWKDAGTSSESLFSLLRGCGYGVFDLDRRQIERVEGYGEIVALTGQTLG